jgi:AcrR family transcriptional regulator
MAETSDSRRATAERNAESILDATQHLLEEGRDASISAVASEAGVSRVTVYAHFEDRRHLLESLAERAVKRAVAALESAEPERGDPREALDRVVVTSWEHLASNEAIARASAAQLSPEAMRRAHESVRGVLTDLIKRGRRADAFRSDLPVDWLVTSALALIHAAADEARSGTVRGATALDRLKLTVGDLLATERRPRTTPSRARRRRSS